MSHSLYNTILIILSLYHIAFSRFIMGFVTTSCSYSSISIKTTNKSYGDDVKSSLIKLSNRLSFKLNSILGDDIGLLKDLKKTIENGPVPLKEREYRINGWRWHTQSVIRDLNRFLQITKKSSSIILASNNNNDNNNINNEISNISTCYNFVYNFNWKALIKVEKEIFFPWVENLLPNSAAPLIDDIISQHKEIIGLSNKINSLCESLSLNKNNKNKIKDDLNEIEVLTLKAQNCALKIQKVQESIFIPCIKSYVTKKEQEVFNRRVITRLGLLDSQIHLVSMYEVIKNNPDEMKLFEKQIPKIVQVTIPVWRKRFYLPMTKCFES